MSSAKENDDGSRTKVCLNLITKSSIQQCDDITDTIHGGAHKNWDASCNPSLAHKYKRQTTTPLKFPKPFQTHLVREFLLLLLLLSLY